MAEHNDLGKWGEDEAVLYLEDQGYTIVDRDWRLGRRDLDILAYTPDGNTLVVVEVKTRTDEDFLQPEEAVTRSKMRNLAIATDAYVRSRHITQEIRFDIIAIVGCNHQVKSLQHLKEAFNPMLIL